MTEQEIKAMLDAHDGLIRACVESRVAFEEFVAAYGTFPAGLEQHAQGAGAGGMSRLFRQRIAFHRRVAGVFSGQRGEGGFLGMGSGAERFLPTVGLRRLRNLVERYPDFRCGEAE